eukprot:TRINITY_DN77552_c0_g1_i1.p1 TRINITY_DN77552_c0_g1~~TRINITY_DN77552_c0_g1_i1.p1  ORF type:complete len:286 (+),score=19.78 TRINITY_DN77552_c0_g1_i1:128-985(+)
MRSLQGVLALGLSLCQQQSLEHLVLHWTDAYAKFQGKTVSVKVGVHTTEHRHPRERWIEFDPTAKPIATPSRLIVPFLASSRYTDHEAFYINGNSRACSSVLRPAGWHSNITDYSRYAKQSCDKLLAVSRPMLWDTNVSGPYPRLYIENCFDCQHPQRIISRDIHPSLHLGNFLCQLSPSKIRWVDIDAQGMDVDLVKSLAECDGLLDRVENIKIECQNATHWPRNAPPVWMYEGGTITSHPNECSEAQRFLEERGFAITRLEMNNCWCSEFNLFMKRIRVQGSS